MAPRYNPDTGNYDTIDDDIYPPPPSAAPSDSREAPYGLSFWNARGYPNEEIFGSNGQLLPGWRRTADGYMYDPPIQSPPRDIYQYGPGTGNDENGPMYGDGGNMGGGNPYFEGMQGEPETPFNWSQFAGPRFDFKSAIGPYVSPTMEEAENEPGYAFARDQGRKTLENSAAGRGVLRTGGTLKDILQFGNKFGEQNYQAVDSRKFRNWGANADREFNTYTTGFDRNYRGDLDSFNARRESEKLDFGDLYNRWRDRLNSLTNIATAGLQS